MREHRFLMFAVVALACYALAGAQETTKPRKKEAPKPPAKQSAKSSEHADVLKAIDAFGNAFNSHDPEKTAECWANDAIYTDRDSGERITGRDKIQAAYAEIFKNRPAVTLSASIHSVRMITPEVAQVEATVTVADAKQPAEDEEEIEPISTDFSAIFKLVKGKWLLDSGIEAEIPHEPTAHDHLATLGWLVGEWHDEGNEEGVKVRNVFRWSAKQAFLIRSYHVEENGELVREGTQVIGWDPVQEQIRSWIFGSEGGFGEGYWTEEDDGWVAKLSGTLPNGSQAIVTQIFKQTGDDSMTSQLVGAEIDGELQPAKPPVKMIRVQPASN